VDLVKCEVDPANCEVVPTDHRLVPANSEHEPARFEVGPADSKLDLAKPEFVPAVHKLLPARREDDACGIEQTRPGSRPIRPSPNAVLLSEDVFWLATELPGSGERIGGAFDRDVTIDVACYPICRTPTDGAGVVALAIAVARRVS
jgi:hypothetical protein